VFSGDTSLSFFFVYLLLMLLALRIIWPGVLMVAGVDGVCFWSLCECWHDEIFQLTFELSWFGRSV
jgi:hypothetical protein